MYECKCRYGCKREMYQSSRGLENPYRDELVAVLIGRAFLLS